MTSKKLLEYKRKLKRASPKFIRQQGRHTKRLRDGWRRPKGVQSKIRLERRGKPRKVKIGYKSPQKLRGRDLDGQETVIVPNLEELHKNQKSKIILASGIGNKKKKKILEQAKKLKVQIYNIKIDEEISRINSQLKLRKEHKRRRAEEKKKKEKKKKEAKKKGAAQSKKEEKKKKESIKDKVQKAREEIEKKKDTEPKKQEKLKETSDKKKKPEQKSKKKESGK